MKEIEISKSDFLKCKAILGQVKYICLGIGIELASQLKARARVYI